LLSPGRGYVEALLTATPLQIAAQLEAGYRASQATSLYGFVRASSDWRNAWVASAGLGVRF
jgi:hypothetical protein